MHHASSRITAAILAVVLACAGGTPAHADAGPDSTRNSTQADADGANDADNADNAAPPLPATRNIYKGNYFIIGAGAGFVPTYDGSRHSSLTPAVGIMGRIGPVSISPRAAGLALDLVPDHGHRISFAIGPSFVYNLNRHSAIDDLVVARLGRLAARPEAGVNGSVSLKRLLTPYDSLSLSSDIRWDVSGNAGRIIAPALSYHTPVSRDLLVTASVFSQFISRKYAAYNYSISQAGSLASGLPVYDAHAGPRAAGVQAALALDLDGNLLDGGWAALVGAGYTRLEGSAAQTPITTWRGTASQWVFGAGIAYAF